MGSTFSNISIRRDASLTHSKVCGCLSALLADRGFRPAAEGQADISFAVYALPSSQWITICENAMLLEDHQAQLDMANLLSAELGRDTLRICCFDSDYLFLNLINPKTKLDAWAGIGSSAGLGIRRRTGIAAWKKQVPDIDRFRQALKKQYIFAEEVLSELSDELALPAEQSFSVFDSLSDTLPDCEITYLHFCIPAGHSPAELPALAHYTYSLVPCTSGRPLTVSCINKGGAGKGIEIFILGKNLAQSGISFTKTTLARWNRSGGEQDHTLVVLEMRQMSDGSIGYYGAVKGFRIPEKVSPALPLAVQVRKESDLHFWFRCVPQCDTETVPGVRIVIRPLQNPDGGIAWQG